MPRTSVTAVEVNLSLANACPMPIVAADAAPSPLAFVLAPVPPSRMARKVADLVEEEARLPHLKNHPNNKLLPHLPHQPMGAHPLIPQVSRTSGTVKEDNSSPVNVSPTPIAAVVAVHSLLVFALDPAPPSRMGRKVAALARVLHPLLKLPRLKAIKEAIKVPKVGKLLRLPPTVARHSTQLVARTLATGKVDSSSLANASPTPIVEAVAVLVPQASVLGLQSVTPMARQVVDLLRRDLWSDRLLKVIRVWQSGG